MPQVTEWARAVPVSGVREIIDLAAGRPDIIRLEMGQPDFPTPSHIVEAAVASARAGSGYTYSAGTPALRAAISDRLRADHGLPATPEQVIVTQGGVQGCSLLLSSLLQPGDEVLIPDPAWPNFEMLAVLHGATPVRYPLRPEDGFVPDPERVAALITARTKILVINTPSNPTGTVFPAEVVDRLLALAGRHDLVVLADEVYDKLIFDGLSAANMATLDPERVVALYSFSKTYSMCGWRVGYLLAPTWLAPTLGRLQEPMLSCLSTVTMAAAEAAMTGPQDAVTEMRDAYQGRRDLAVGLLRAGGLEPVPPQGAFYLMVSLAPGADSWACALDLVERDLAVSPGAAYGDVAAGHLRLSLASSPDALRTGIARLLDWFADTGGGQVGVRERRPAAVAAVR